MSKFLNNINLEAGNDIQFKTTAGSNAGKIELDGNNLVLSNPVGDVLLGDGSSDVYIGDGTNNVDILFEQSGSIKGDGSAVTLTIGGANTTLNLENPNVNGTFSINDKLTLTGSSGYILFDYEPTTAVGEYTTEVPLLKVDRSGSELTILSRLSNNGAIALGNDDTVAIIAGDTKGAIKDNLSYASETVIFAAEQGFHAYGFPSNNTTWTNRNEFRFYSGSSTASNNGLYIGEGSSTQFIDLSRNLKNIGTIGSGAITSSGSVTATSFIKSGGTTNQFLKANGNVDGTAYAPLASPALTGNPTAPTQAANNNSTRIATTAYVQTELTDLIGAAPAALDTLSELADAINDDSAFSSTVTTALGNRLRVDTASQGLNSTQKSNARTNLGLGTAATSNTSAFLGATAKAADSELLDGVNGDKFFRTSTNPSVAGSGMADTNLSIGDSGTSYAFVQSHGGKPLRINPAGNSVTIGSSNGTAWHSANDGSGSGLDADLLDGNHASAFMGSSGMAANADVYMNFRVLRNSNSSAANDGMYIGYGNSNSGQTRIFGGGSTGVHLAINATNMAFNNNAVWHAGNDGSGSGLDADLLDGNHASAFAPLASPALTGSPTAPTQSSSESSTKIATTAYVKSQGYITSADGGNATTLDGIDSSSFLRSDTADTATGNLYFNGTQSWRDATLWQVSASDGAIQRADARDDDTDKARLHWYGKTDSGTNTNFRHAWYDGSDYVNVDVTSQTVTFDGAIAATGGNSTNWNTAYGWGNHASAGYRTGNQTITLSGDVSGSGTTSISVTVADDSHNHVISNVDGLQTALNAKAPLASPSLTGSPTAPTQSSSENSTKIATTAYVKSQGYVTTDTNTTYSAGTGLSLSGTTFSLTDTASKLSLSGGTLTGTLNSRDIKLGSGYHLMRSNHHSGHLEGSYNNVGANAEKSNPIYTIGSSYNPTDAALSSMYGIGYTHTNASFISFTGASGWGQYVAANGDARIFLCGSNGVISSTGEHYVGSSKVFHDTYHPNADTLTTARTIAGTSFNGSANIDISYNNLTNKPTIPSLSGYATESYVSSEISNLIGGAPAALDTLNELAAAINDDASYASSITTALAGKLPLAGGTMTGQLICPSASTTRPVLTGGFLSRNDNGDGDHDVHGLSERYYPSNTTTADAWGLQWNGTNNQYRFIGAGSVRLSIDLDGGNTDLKWNNNSIFHAGYHPNADTLTTARTIALSGAVTGSASFNGGSNITIATTATADPTLTLSGDASGSATFTNLGNATLSVTVANDSHTHDSRYYTESEVQTFFKRGYINAQSAGNLAVGWYTIAQNSGDRAFGEFQIWDTAGSRHQSVIFNAAHHYGQTESNSITVLGNSSYGTHVFRYVRIKENGTYDGAAIQVYIDDSTNGVNVAIVGGNAQNSGWELVDWLADSSAPSLISNWSGASEQGKIDLDNIENGGIATTGKIYGDGLQTQYRMFNDNYHPNADTLTTARNITLAGDVTGATSFNGATNITINASLASDSVGASEIAASAVGASELNVSGNGTTAQFLRSDGDGTFTWATPTDTNTTYSVGDGGLTQKNFTTTLKSKLDGIADSANNYSLPLSTSSTRGGVKIGYTESGKNYPVELDSSEKMFVNVPWTDTNTNTTYSAGTGITLSGTTFSLTDTASKANLSGATFTGDVTIGNGSADTNLHIKKSDNNVSDHIVFYNGTTRVGEIGVEDTTWLRINQETAKNIYTPRYIRADGGFFVDGASKGIDGSGNFIGGTITGASDANVSNWNTAYGWGNHASAGYVTSNTQLSTEQVQDAVGAMLTGNTESGITVTYDDTNNEIDFTVASQTDQNFTTALKSKLDGIATSANNYSLPLSSSSTRGGVKIGYTESGKNYPVELDSSEKMFVNVPWTDNNTTYSVGDGGLTQKNFTTTLKNKLDGIAASANNYSLPAGSSSTRGGFKIGFTESGKNYPVEVSSEQMYVNVPWTDTNTNTTYTAGRGLEESSSEFRLQTDLRDSISYIGYDSNDYIQWSNNTSVRAVVAGTQRLIVGSSGIDVTGNATADTFRTDTNNVNYNLLTRNHSSNTLYVQAAQSNSSQPIASFRYGSATVNGGTETFRIRRDNVNVFGANFTVGGSITGNSKNFSIPHPTKEGKRLVHSCLEGPEIGVYFRGRSTSATIEMPDYWGGLVHLDSMTVELTAIGPNQDLYVEDIADDGDVTVGSNTETALNYFYVVYGERKDLERLEVEIDDTVEVEESSDNSEEA